MNTFTAKGKRYTFQILARHSPAGMDRSCITVTITDENRNQWTGQTDLSDAALANVQARLCEWLRYAFEYYAPAKIPDRFEIPKNIPEGDPLPHRCTVRSGIG